MSAQESRHDFNLFSVLLFELVDNFEKHDLGVEVQAVARFHFQSGSSLRNESLNVFFINFEDFFESGLSAGSHRGFDTSASSSDI